MEDKELLNLALDNNEFAFKLMVRFGLAIHFGFTIGSGGSQYVVKVWRPTQSSDQGVFERIHLDSSSDAKAECVRKAICRSASEIIS